jgi:hypothetical protein
MSAFVEEPSTTLTVAGENVRTTGFSSFSQPVNSIAIILIVAIKNPNFFIIN